MGKKLAAAIEGSRGSRHWNAKFDESVIEKIRLEHLQQEERSIRALARKYDTTWETMAGILKHRTWKHVAFSKGEVREIRRIIDSKLAAPRSLARELGVDEKTLLELLKT